MRASDYWQWLSHEVFGLSSPTITDLEIVPTPVVVAFWELSMRVLVMVTCLAICAAVIMWVRQTWTKD